MAAIMNTAATPLLYRGWRLLAVALLTCLACVSARAAGFEGDTRGCAVDQPCFSGARQVGDKVVFNFGGDFDFYNLRYAHNGGVKQVENRSGTYAFTGVRANRVYTLNVQGCKSRPLRRSSCSDWTQESVTTR